MRIPFRKMVFGALAALFAGGAFYAFSIGNTVSAWLFMVAVPLALITAFRTDIEQRRGGDES